MTYLITNNYEQFDFYKDNREIYYRHVDKLVESFKKNGQMQPILCVQRNGKLYVVDGQHRLQACKTLGIPVNYIIDNNLNSESVTDINTTQKNMSQLDWIKRYAAQGNKNYAQLLQQIKYYKGIFSGKTERCVALAYHSGQNKTMRPYVREGKYKINGFKGTQILNLCQKLYAFYDDKAFLKYVTVSVVSNLFRDKLFEEKKLLKKIKLTKLNIFLSEKDTYDEFIRVYNYKGKDGSKRLKKIA